MSGADEVAIEMPNQSVEHGDEVVVAEEEESADMGDTNDNNENPEQEADRIIAEAIPCPACCRQLTFFQLG